MRLWKVGGMLACALASCVLSSPAQALEWRRADTPRFIVYSDGDAGTLREAAQQLELYETALRLMHQLDPNGASAQRIAIYLVRDHAGLTAVEPDLRDEVAGFYQATDDEIFAMAIRERRDQSTLLHEYAHHFMIGSFATGFPAWFIEGYAEYFASAQLQPRRMVVGEVDRGRGDWLTYGQWLPLDLILTRRPFEFEDPNAVSMYYAQSWLLTHWFLSDSSRMPMLYAYINQLRQGAEPIAAMEIATGMTAARLERTLRDYSRQRLAIKIISGDQFPQPEVHITSVAPAEGQMIPLSLRLSSTVGEDEALLAEIRRQASTYPDDRFARLLLARAELRLGDRDAARTLLEGLLTETPEDADALRLLGEAIWDQARDGPSDQLALVREARGHLAKAYALNPDDYRTLFLLAETRQVSPDFPSDNDVETLLAALDLAPQVPTLRIFTAQARARRQEYAQAIDLLQPLASSPHPSGATVLARTLIDRYQTASEEAEADQENVAAP